MATIKNAVDLSTQAETDIADNTTQEISAEDERSLFLNIIASTLNIKDGGLVIQAQAGYNSAITPSSNYAFSTKKYVDDSISGIDLSALWNKSGNTLSSRGTFGSTSGAYGWDFKRAGTTVGGLGDTTGWYFGTNAAFTDTYFSIKSSSNLGTFNALAIKDSDNATIFEFKSTGNIKTAGGFLNASDNVICNFYASNLYRENSGPKVVVDWANTLLKDNDAVDRINWHFSWLLTGVTVDLDWGNHRLEGSWKVIENFSIGATPSYGSGTEQFFQMESVTPSATAPTGGIRKQVVNGAEFTLLPTGENICTAGKVITDADDYTQTVGVVKMKYTGAGGHTFTMHTAVGYAGSSYVIKNSGSGNLTIDGNSTETIDGNLTEVVPAGESRVLYSDGSNLFII